MERFINICMSKRIILQDLQRIKSTSLKAKILKSDFKKIKNIAKKTKSRVHIEKKVGIPFLLNRYRKRKIFAISIFIIAIILFCVTRFIWNIEIIGLENIDEREIIAEIESQGIYIGKLKNSIELEKIINSIRIKRDDIAWIGIKVKGTNLIVEIVESTKKPEIIDKSKVSNIVADKDGVISKITVHSGTAKVKVGDFVKKR